MAPAQPFMEIDQDCKPFINPKLELDTENRSSLLNCEDTCTTTADVDIDIIECRRNNDHQSSRRGEDDDIEDPNATEYSSSFADTTSDNESVSGFSDGEVQSHFFADNGLASFDAFSSAFSMRCVHRLFAASLIILSYLARCNMSTSSIMIEC